MESRDEAAAPCHAWPALVVGFSVHGLAVARALAQQGIEVHALANFEDPPQPTIHTRYAKVHVTRDLNTAPLAETLRGVAARIPTARKIVLFPTSDRIAKSIAEAWPQLSDRFLLSWADCRELVLELQRKDSLAKYCERAGVRYPRSRPLQRAADCDAAARELTFPLVIKPAQPLSSFKAIQINSVEELRASAATYERDLPFVIQEWIDGPEPSLYACTIHVDRGKPLFAFTSRKLAASPPGVGQGTVFESIESAEAEAITRRFIAVLDITGPVAAEFKRDAKGQFWFIEPNVGRTEYCVDLTIQCGFNLPYVEYRHATGQAIGSVASSKKRDGVWFDTDKDPACVIACRGALRDPQGRRRAAIFPFFGHGDWKPFVASCWRQARGLVPAIRHRITGTAIPRRQ